MTRPTDVAAVGETAIIGGYTARQLARHLLTEMDRLRKRGTEPSQWACEAAEVLKRAGLEWERRVESSDFGPNHAPNSAAVVQSADEERVETSEAARMLSLGERAVRKLVSSGELEPWYRGGPGRPHWFRRDDVLALRERREQR